MKNENSGVLHSWGLLKDERARRLFQTCTCGWRAQISLVDSTASRYADASLWTSHFDLDLKSAPFL